MSPDFKQLGIEALEKKCWAWAPGMMTILGVRITAQMLQEHMREGRMPDGWIPFLGDDATIGCIVSHLRGLHGHGGVGVMQMGGYKEGETPIWNVLYRGIGGEGEVGWGSSQAEAIVNALDDYDVHAQIEEEE